MARNRDENVNYKQFIQIYKGIRQHLCRGWFRQLDLGSSSHLVNHGWHFA